jgi:kumamolisin
VSIPEGFAAIPLSRRAPAMGARAVGPTDANAPIEVSLVLRAPVTLGQLARVGNIGRLAPQARAHLSRDAFASGYGADPPAMARIESFARQAGLTVRQSDAARRTVVLGGTVAQASAAFGIRLQDFVLPDGSRYRARIGPALVPTTLSNVVEAVLGFDDRPQARPHFQRLDELYGRAFAAEAVIRADATIHAESAIRADGPAVAWAAPTPFSPTEVAALYDFPQTAGGTKLDGRGQCIGIIELGGGYRSADLKAYFAALGLKAPRVTAVGVDGARNQPGDEADNEVMLDIEVAGAVAPGAQIVVYFAPNTGRGFYDAITTAIHDTTHNPSIITISWGAPEGKPAWTSQSMRLYSQAFKEAAALGVTICCASGDLGSGDGVDDGRAHVDFPAASPFVLACGGTQLRAAGQQIAAEVVWNAGPGSATGGGVSESFARPTWQKPVGVPPSVNAPHKVGRGVPDVAGNADPRSGYRVRVNGEDTVIGGTSAVAPLWAGLIALVNQALGQPAGYLNPLLYTAPSAAWLRDITAGNNGAYAARAGWDACTGLGSPNGRALLDRLRGP